MLYLFTYALGTLTSLIHNQLAFKIHYTSISDQQFSAGNTNYEPQIKLDHETLIL